MGYTQDGYGIPRYRDAAPRLAIDCSRNEFLFPHPIVNGGPRPRLGAERICRYQASPGILTQLSERFGCSPALLRMHNGAEAALKAVFAGVARLRDATLLLPEPGWDYHATLAKRYGIPVESYRYVELGDRYELDLADLRRRIERLACPVLLLVSPSNPLGCRVADETLLALARHVATKGYCVVDQAYFGFADPPNLDWSVGELLSKAPSTMLVRTMSKYYGIPGLRVGFTAADPVTHARFGMEPDYLGFNAYSDEFAARCLEAHDEFARIARTVVRQRDALIAGLSAIPGFQAYRSEANFVLVRTPSDDYAQWLAAHGVKVRTFTAELSSLVRITVPPEDHVRSILEATDSFRVHATAATRSRETLPRER